MPDSFDASICPFCQSKNQCMAYAEEPCWCNYTSVPAELIALLPEKARGKACICQACVKLFIADPEAFKKNIL